MEQSRAPGFTRFLLVLLSLRFFPLVVTQETLPELMCSLYPNVADCTAPATTVQVGDSCGLDQRCVRNVECSNASITGEGKLDIRFSADNLCVNYLLTCCYDDDIIQTATAAPTQTPPTSPSGRTPTPPTSPSGRTPTPPTSPGGRTPSPPTPSAPPVQDFQVCGRRNPNGVGFRIQQKIQNEAEYGEFPWMMAILLRQLVLGEPVLQYSCGGSLIHPGVVLTAAHCVRNKDRLSLVVRGGEWDTQNVYETFPTQNSTVAEVVIHPDYYRGGLFNDIALLFLDEPMELNEVVQTVCLPEQGTNFDRQRCFVSGWGKDKFGKEGIYQVILKSIDVPVVPSGPCQETLRGTRLKQSFNLHESFLCAGGELGKDACQGDGGSPLVCSIDDSDHYQQAGIVAWGIGCGEDQIPGMYAAVARFRQWIDQEMVARKLDISSYEPH